MISDMENMLSRTTAVIYFHSKSIQFNAANVTFNTLSNIDLCSLESLQGYLDQV